MLVREIMHSDPVTITAETTLDKAYCIMRERGIRHLPIMDGGRLAGIVTDRDLRLATSRLTQHPFAPDAEVRAVMSQPVQTTQPLEPIEIAARTMRELKIGSLPVVDGDALVGIVTGVDILDALLMLTGVHLPSGRLEVRLADKVGELARLATLLSQRQISIQSVLTYPNAEQRGRIVLRLATMDIRPLVAVLCEAGFEVVWPPTKPCRD
jgi:acetoin utilization protein AcuB